MTTVTRVALEASLAMVLLAAGTAEAGPWGRDAGHYYLKLSGSRLVTTKLATPAAEVVTIPEFELSRLELYGELGLGNRITVLTTVPFQHRTEIENFESASGFGDLRFALQADLGQASGWRAALRVMAQAPTGDASKGGGVLPTGSGVWESEFSASLGRSFTGGYLFVDAGHQIRGGGFRDGLIYRAELGFDLGSRVDLGVHVHGVEPYGDDSAAARSSGAGLGDGVRYAVVGPSVSINLGTGLALGFDLDHSFHARNLATGNTFRLGLSLTH